MNLPSPEEVLQIVEEQIPAFMVQLAALQSTLAARLLATNGNSVPSPVQDDRLLDIAQASERLGVSKDWLYRRSKKLPFTVRLGNQLRFSSKGLDQYIRQRKGQ